jgi:hypothetical protein
MGIVKINQLPSATAATDDDLVLILDDPSGVAVTKQVSVDALRDSLLNEPANLQIRRGTASEVSGIIPLDGEPVWTTDQKSLVVGDGQTLGGILIGPKVAKTFINASSTRIGYSSQLPPDFIRFAPINFPTDIGGITSPSGCYEVLITNVGLYNATVKHQLSTGSPTSIPPSGDRIITPSGADYVLPTGYSARLIYDTVVQRWRVVV